MEQDLITELEKMILNYESLKKTEADRHFTYLPKGINISATYGEVSFLLRREIYEMLEVLNKNSEMEEEEIIELIMYNGVKYIYNTLKENEKINNAT